MATVASLPERSVALTGVSWATYERLLAEHEDRKLPVAAARSEPGSERAPGELLSNRLTSGSGPGTIERDASCLSCGSIFNQHRSAQGTRQPADDSNQHGRATGGDKGSPDGWAAPLVGCSGGGKSRAL